MHIFNYHRSSEMTFGSALAPDFILASSTKPGEYFLLFVGLCVVFFSPRKSITDLSLALVALYDSERAKEKPSQHGRMKLFSCRGISGLQVVISEAVRGEGRSCLPTSPSACLLQKCQAFCNPSRCPLEWVRKGSHELFSWGMWRGGNRSVLEAERKLLQLAQRMWAEGLWKPWVLSSLQAFPPSGTGSASFSGVINNAAAIHSEGHSALAANGAASDPYWRLL